MFRRRFPFAFFSVVFVCVFFLNSSGHFALRSRAFRVISGAGLMRNDSVKIRLVVEEMFLKFFFFFSSDLTAIFSADQNCLSNFR